MKTKKREKFRLKGELEYELEAYYEFYVRVAKTHEKQAETQNNYAVVDLLFGQILN